MSQPLSVSFIVPCFNEENNVAPTVESIREAAASLADYEILLVNDCSLDRTLERMQTIAASDPRVRVIVNEVNLGIGGGYKRGVAIARCNHAIMIPGDDGFPGTSIAEILRHAGEADIVIPEVVNPGVRSALRAFTSRGFTTLLNWLFWLDVRYYNGAVLHRTDLLRKINILTDGFAYQAEALVKLIAAGATYTHCSVRIQERKAGRSSALSARNQLAVWRTIFHLVRDPGLFRRIRLAPLAAIAGDRR